MDKIKAYFGFNNRGREFLYIPFNLVGYDYKNEFVLNWDSNVLQKLGLIINKNSIDRESLENKGWEINTIDVPYRLLKGFQDCCWKCRKQRKIRNKAFSIYNWVWRNTHLWELEKSEDIEDHIEDYEDDWWKRGDSFKWE